MYPVFKDGKLDSFNANDGSSWMKSFSEMPRDMFEEISKFADQDPWALYRVVRENGEFKGFSAIYGFGNLSSGTCMVDDESGTVLDAFDIPAIAAKAFLQGYGGDFSGDPGNWRPRLNTLLKQQRAETQDPSPSSDDKPSIENACGVLVQNALIEIGEHKPPKVFTPERVNGRLEFNYLSEADEPLRAMCFSGTDDKSLYREPLPEGLRRCEFENRKLSCWGKLDLKTLSFSKNSNESTDNLEALFRDPDRVPKDPYSRRAMEERLGVLADEMAATDPYSQALIDEPKVLADPASQDQLEYVGERPYVDDLPSAVQQEFFDWDSSCQRDQKDAVGKFSPDYLTKVDIDLDGKDDFILNNDGASCSVDGKVVAHGGGNGGTVLRIISHNKKVLEDFTQGAEVFAYKGYAVVRTGGGIFKITKGKSTKIAKRPKGGKSVYVLSR
jgi:hypothetical protein